VRSIGTANGSMSISSSLFITLAPLFFPVSSRVSVQLNAEMSSYSSVACNSRLTNPQMGRPICRFVPPFRCRNLILSAVSAAEPSSSLPSPEFRAAQPKWLVRGAPRGSGEPVVPSPSALPAAKLSAAELAVRATRGHLRCRPPWPWPSSSRHCRFWSNF
jgi:hypothetical protein